MFFCYNITISLFFSVTISQYRYVFFLLQYHNIVMFPCYRYMICYNWFTAGGMLQYHNNVIFLLQYHNNVMFFCYNIKISLCFSVTTSKHCYVFLQYHNVVMFFCFNIVMFPCYRYMTYYNWFTASSMLQYNITMSPRFSVKICYCAIL